MLELSAKCRINGAASAGLDPLDFSTLIPLTSSPAPEFATVQATKLSVGLLNVVAIIVL